MKIRPLYDRVVLKRIEDQEQMIGGIIEAYNPGAAVGALCTILDPTTRGRGQAAAVGF